MRVNLEARAATAESRRAKTRARLVEGAITVILEKGPDHASIEDFVAAAGVSRGTFYNYFPTVEGLLHALNTEISEALDQTLAPLRTGHEDPAVLLSEAFHLVFAAFAADPVRGWLSLRIEATAMPRQAVFQARFDAIYQAAAATGRFRDGGLAAARNLAFGGFRLAQRDIVMGEAGPEHAIDLVALLLTAFGLEAEEARRISRAGFQAARP